MENKVEENALFEFVLWGLSLVVLFSLEYSCNFMANWKDIVGFGVVGLLVLAGFLTLVLGAVVGEDWVMFTGLGVLVIPFLSLICFDSIVRICRMRTEETLPGPGLDSLSIVQ